MAQPRSAPGAHKVSDVGRYRLIAELARGGMGVVFLAIVRDEEETGKLLVLKELKAHLAEEPSLAALFLEEARISVKLDHPSIVHTVEAGTDGDRHFIAMEYLDGQSLNHVMARAERTGIAWPLHFHLRVMIDVLDGLQYAHDLTDSEGKPFGVVHRDVSPHNVFVGYEGQVKVLDFGIAKALDSSHQTAAGILKGKVAYMSPEQSLGQPVDRRSDVFAAGVMLWEAVAGERMWKHLTNDLAILRALTDGALPNLRERRPDVDPRLASIIDRAVAWNAAERYPSAGELRADLRAYLSSLPVEAFTLEDIGTFVADLFAHDRAEMQAVIDAQLALLRGMSTSEFAALSLPDLAPDRGSDGTPSETQAVDRDSMAAVVPPPGIPPGDVPGPDSPPVASHRPRASKRGVLIVGLLVVTTALVTMALSTSRPDARGALPSPSTR